jgi:hypothetical protein
MKQARRLAVVYVPNGIIMKDWKPATAGQEFAFTRILKPLEPFRQDITLLSGLANRAAEKAKGGGHAKASGSFLSGAEVKYTAGPDVRAGVTFDQIVAQRCASETRVPSLQIGCEDARMVGNCDTGSSCAYTNSLSWKNAETPLPVEVNPRSVFERLFGAADPNLPADVRVRRALYRKSILDHTREDAQRLMTSLGAADRRRMDQFLTGIREIEMRICLGERSVTPPSSLRNSVRVPGLCEVMFDLRRSRSRPTSRVSTMMLGWKAAFARILKSASLIHTIRSRIIAPSDFIEKVTKINCFHVELFAGFVEKLCDA